MSTCALLPSRAVFEISGEDAREFLQNILTNDVEQVAERRATYTALLTPQGKFLFDFFLMINPDQPDDGLLVDVAASRCQDLIKRLTMYRLRAKVDFTPRDDLCVVAIFSKDALREMGLDQDDDATPGQAWNMDQGYVFTDPRNTALGARMITANPAALSSFPMVDEQVYLDLQLLHGVPDSSTDIAVEKDFLLEDNFSELNGVDFKKGCFIGQELVSRMRNRKSVKKRLMPFVWPDQDPAVGDRLLVDGKDAGTIRSVRDAMGMAYIRLAYLDGEFHTESGIPVTLRRPSWLPDPIPFLPTKKDD